MQFDKTIPRDKLLIKLFKIAQRVPYRITPFDKSSYACRETVTANLTKGDCRHKTKLLYNLLMQNNFEAEKVKVIFDWKDLPVPKKILGILKKSGTIWSHDVIEIKLSRYCKSYLDPTWNPELKELGFPVTREWDGKESTKQVTTENLQYFEADNFKSEEHNINIEEEEYNQFAQALNKWLEESS